MAGYEHLEQTWSPIGTSFGTTANVERSDSPIIEVCCQARSAGPEIKISAAWMGHLCRGCTCFSRTAQPKDVGSVAENGIDNRTLPQFGRNRRSGLTGQSAASIECLAPPFDAKHWACNH
jgi:hypothetical protein